MVSIPSVQSPLFGRSPSSKVRILPYRERRERENAAPSSLQSQSASGRSRSSSKTRSPVGKTGARCFPLPGIFQQAHGSGRLPREQVNGNRSTGMATYQGRRTCPFFAQWSATSYFFAARTLAQRSFCAAAILARACALSLRRLRGAGVPAPLVPNLKVVAIEGLAAAGMLPPNTALACCSRAISKSIAWIIVVVSMYSPSAIIRGIVPTLL